MLEVGGLGGCVYAGGKGGEEGKGAWMGWGWGLFDVSPHLDGHVGLLRHCGARTAERSSHRPPHRAAEWGERGGVCGSEEVEVGAVSLVDDQRNT